MSTSNSKQPAPAPQAESEANRTGDFQELRHAELEEISRRRSNAQRLRLENEKPPKDCLESKEPQSDAIGLALSGGGIRAASVGLGALQALQATGHFDEIDYLSTVSGGGYIGAYVSSAAVSSAWSVNDALGDGEPPTSQDTAPAKNPDATNGQSPSVQDAPGPSKAENSRAETPAKKSDTAYGQPQLVQRLIFGGKYLNRPWELANKYLIGLFLNNLLLFSGLVALGALIAFVWRCLDYDAVRDFLELFDLNSGIVTAFLPFAVFFVCWIIAWLMSYFKHEAEAPGTWAQRWLYLAVAAFCIGVTVLLVNAETNLGFLDWFFGTTKIEGSSSLGKWLLGLVGAGLTPLLMPKRLLKAGLQPKSVWQRAAFRTAMLAMFVGVPLAVVGVLARSNISDTAIDPDRNLRNGDIYSWPAFLGVLRDLHNRRGQVPPAIVEDLADKKIVPKADYDNTISALDTLAIDTVKDKSDALDVVDKQIDRDPSRGARLLELVNWQLIRDNELAADWNLTRELEGPEGLKVKLCRQFSNGVLDSPILPFLLVDSPSATKSDAAAESMEAVMSALPGLRDMAIVLQLPSATPDRIAANHLIRIQFDRLREELANLDRNWSTNDAELAEALEEAEFGYLGGRWTPKFAKKFNLKLLRALHPESFFIDGKAYRQLVIAGDQATRLSVFWIAGGIFVLAGLFINLNTASVHRFYRNRLRQAFFVPYKSDGRTDFDLSALDTAAKGAPYHLINATIDLFRPQLMDKADAEYCDLQRDRRDVQTFLFSRLYCGSDATGWIRTEHYEKFRKDNINFADAIALSGAATDPMRVNSLPLGIAMWGLNLNLSQWMPNPRNEKPRWKPNLAVLLRDWFRKPVEKSTYCYVSDGGFTDNLGVMSLLRRRCRLIISVDAGADKQQEYCDLTWLIRYARMRYGIKLLQLANKEAGEQVLDTTCLDPDAKGLSKKHFVVARIVYPEAPNEPAWLVYLKPSFTGDEGADLLKYRLEDKEFPNDDTVNQFYEEQKVESYRQMGFHITKGFCDRAAPGGDSSLVAGMPELEQRIVKEGEEADARAKLRSDLPADAHAALSIGERIATSLEQEEREGPKEQARVALATWERIANALERDDHEGRKKDAYAGLAIGERIAKALEQEDHEGTRKDAQAALDIAERIAKALEQEKRDAAVAMAERVPEELEKAVAQEQHEGSREKLKKQRPKAR